MKTRQLLLTVAMIDFCELCWGMDRKNYLGRLRRDAFAHVVMGEHMKTMEAVTMADMTTDETREVLMNPFQNGDSVLIPAGTTYTTTDPKMRGRHKTRRASTVVVDDSFPAFFVRTQSGRIMGRPLRIRTTGSGGYWKDINITESVVTLNGKTPHYEKVPVQV